MLQKNVINGGEQSAGLKQTSDKNEVIKSQKTRVRDVKTRVCRPHSNFHSLLLRVAYSHTHRTGRNRSMCRDTIKFCFAFSRPPPMPLSWTAPAHSIFGGVVFLTRFLSSTSYGHPNVFDLFLFSKSFFIFTLDDERSKLAPDYLVDSVFLELLEFLVRYIRQLSSRLSIRIRAILWKGFSHRSWLLLITPYSWLVHSLNRIRLCSVLISTSLKTSLW